MKRTDHDDAGATGPIFVCGADRSGTSLVFALLSSHPALSMVRRTNLWRWFHGKFGDLADGENLDRAISTLAGYERLSVLEPDWDRIRREFTAGPATYGRLFELLHRHRAERLGRQRWGDKSLHSEYFANAIFAEFPDARVIQTIRDPRDRWASISNRYDDDRAKGIAAATGRWLSSVRAADENVERYGTGYRVVRFEDLATDPIGVTRDLCDFIGEPFVPEMMEMRGAPEHARGNSSFGDLPPSTISTKPIGRYRTRLSAEEVAFIQIAAGRLMRRHGYESDPMDADYPRRLRFAAATAPVELGRLAVWTVRDHYQRPRATVPTHRLGREAS